MMRRICRSWDSVAAVRAMWRPDRERRVDLVLVVIFLSLVVWLFKSMVQRTCT